MNPEGKPFTCGTLNVRTLKGKRKSVIRDMEAFQIDILGLSETRMRGKRVISWPRGYTLYSSGCEDVGNRPSSGVAILVPPHMKHCIVRHKLCDDRMVWIETMNTIFIQIYAPVSGKFKEFKAFLDKLKNEIQESQSGNKKSIVMGDFNARVGSSQTLGAVGSDGPAFTNKSGKELVKLCEDIEYIVANTYRLEGDIRCSFSARRENVNIETLIDYILIPKYFLILNDDWCSTIKNAHTKTDHRIVIMRNTPM